MDKLLCIIIYEKLFNQIAGNLKIAEFNVGITGVTGVTAIIARFMELVTGIPSPHLYTNFY